MKDLTSVVFTSPKKVTHTEASMGCCSPSLAKLCLLFLFIASVVTVSESESVIFVFGDSNSDTGGLASGLGFPINLPNGRSFFRRSTGRLSDGRLVIDFLCKSFSSLKIHSTIFKSAKLVNCNVCHDPS